MRRVVLLATLTLLAWRPECCATEARASTVASEPVVKLSPYEVKANSVEFRHWIKVGSPNFILYTDATDREASETLGKFEMLYSTSQIFFGRMAMNLGPVTVILPTASSDWRKLETKGSVEWKSALSAVGDPIADLLVVQYDWQEEGLSIVYAGLARLYLDRLAMRGPFWFWRGIGGFYETAEFEKDKVTLGRANPRIWELQHGIWLPWARFFAITASSNEFRKESTIGQYEAQVSIFTHFLFTNPDRVWISRLTSWLSYLNAGHEPTEAEFKAIFGQDWKEWQRTMQDYVAAGRYQMYTLRPPAKMYQFTETKYKLPVTEIRELFVLAQIELQRASASETSLDALLAGGLKSEALREQLVSACLHWNRNEAALANLQTLVAQGSRNPRVYLVAALEAAERPGNRLDDQTLTPAATIEVRKLCQRAVELEPRFPEANELLASTEAEAASVDQQGIAAIEAAYTRVRGYAPTGRIVVALATALWRSGDATTARQLGEKVQQDPLAERSARKEANELMQRMSAPPAGVPPEGRAVPPGR